jgi:hypothetical protein
MAIPPLPKKLYKDVPAALDAIKRAKQRRLRLYKIVVSEDILKGTFGYAIGQTDDVAHSTFCEVMGIGADHIPITSKKVVTLTTLRAMVTHMEEIKNASTNETFRKNLDAEIEKIKAQILERTPAAARSLVPEGKPDLATTPAVPVTPAKGKKKKKSAKAAPAPDTPPEPAGNEAAPPPPPPAPDATSGSPAIPPAPVQVPDQQPPAEPAEAPRPVPVPVVPPTPPV